MLTDKIYNSIWGHFYHMNYWVMATTWGRKNSYSCPSKTRTRRSELSLNEGIFLRYPPPESVSDKLTYPCFQHWSGAFFCSALLSWSSVCSGPFWSQSNLQSLRLSTSLFKPTFLVVPEHSFLPASLPTLCDICLRDSVRSKELMFRKFAAPLWWKVQSSLLPETEHPHGCCESRRCAFTAASLEQ